MLVVGLTGGIGSGKSIVCEMFARLGVPVIDADIIAKQVVSPGAPALNKICDHFGSLVCQDGILDRKKLRDIIFRDRDERVWLENLLHPLIRDEMQSQLLGIAAPYCILAIPLLLEVTPYEFINRILVIDTDEAKQIERVMARDQVSGETVHAMMATQVSRAERLSRATDVISNDADLLTLEKEVTLLHAKYLEVAKSEC